MIMRHYRDFDHLIIRLDKALRTLRTTAPVEMLAEIPDVEESLSAAERRNAANLMRVNHSGEVSAQALYLGQAVLAKDPALAEMLLKSACEEKIHLVWCQARLKSLKTRPSLFNPVWAVGSFAMGLLAGLCSDKISLGFLAETENQVSAHLDEHLEKLPKNDFKSRLVLEKMKEDEMQHADNALKLGGIPLPGFVRYLMRKTAKIMTSVAYRL
jgi:ubiquinone biosynthesis monooxygenase Coq7